VDFTAYEGDTMKEGALASFTLCDANRRLVSRAQLIEVAD